MSDHVTGRCLCGDVQFTAAGNPLWAGHCHCRRCRRSTGAAFATWISFHRDAVRWAAQRPKLYRSTATVERGFCPSCGSTVSFHRLDRTSLAAGTFDDPGQLAPAMHVFAEEELGWSCIPDGLPRFRRFPPEFEQFDDPAL
jgi:hypothetical protein